MSCFDQVSSEAKELLVTSFYQEEVFFWIGSGFSRNFGCPSWADVLNGVAEEISYDEEINTDAPLRAAELLFSYSVIEHGYDEYQFNSLVLKVLQNKTTKVEWPDWVDNFKKISPKLIVTTNWDTVLEELFEFLPNVVVRGEKKPRVSTNRKNILKIHGGAGRPESVVITNSQYNFFQREDTYLNRKLYTLFTEGMPIFIGYSLTDPNIGFLYEEVYAHIGEEKSPAFMIVRPSVDEAQFKETKLLFSNKQVYLIKAEIGEFVSDLIDEIEQFIEDNRQFWIDHENIKDKIYEIVSKITDGERLSDKKLIKKFPGRESGHQAIEALVSLMEMPNLYQDAGGNLLSPDGRISYTETNNLIQTLIKLLNEYSSPSVDVRNRFHACVVDNSTTGPGIWDFYQAKVPFENILAIHPNKKSKYFLSRLRHIRDVLQWSSPTQVGKCWSTWSVFKKRLDWFNYDEIFALVKMVEDEEDGLVSKDDVRWMKAIKSASAITDEIKEKIDEIIA
ncbi:SIR2 family protein [Pleionea sp. CnH1-48]|uniref:SIR2 family protein n=1 Tax=Pleionea sp. CnH1-48 TaxID=2954494 RepID=UPI002097767F|nr:SIR2 family protein [Pleionea sp. CnH1-48]MCO7226638.1 SIR2 family protein [Pleionea sp. CnH1-48]